MTDQELDRMFAAVRDAAPPAIPSIRAQVLERIAAESRPLRKRWWPWALVPVLAAAAALLVVWRPVPPPATLDLVAPRIAAPAPAVPAVASARRPVPPPRRAPAEPRTRFIQTGTHSEVHMTTADPDVVIIWVAGEQKGDEDLDP